MCVRRREGEWGGGGGWVAFLKNPSRLRTGSRRQTAAASPHEALVLATLIRAAAPTYEKTQDCITGCSSIQHRYQAGGPCRTTAGREGSTFLFSRGRTHIIIIVVANSSAKMCPFRLWAQNIKSSLPLQIEEKSARG